MSLRARASTHRSAAVSVSGSRAPKLSSNGGHQEPAAHGALAAAGAKEQRNARADEEELADDQDAQRRSAGAQLRVEMQLLLRVELAVGPHVELHPEAAAQDHEERARVSSWGGRLRVAGRDALRYVMQ